MYMNNGQIVIPKSEPNIHLKMLNPANMHINLHPHMKL